MLKNVATQLYVYCWDSTTGLPKTGDAANLTAYAKVDTGSVTSLADTSAAEVDSTNAKGWYQFDLTQGETNGDLNLYTCKSSTSNIVCMVPEAVVRTLPTTGILAPATAGRTLVVDAAGLADANTVKLGPSGSGTAQTARDLGASVLLSVGTGTGQVNLASGKVPATIAAGDLAANSLTASALATDAVTEIRDAITGGAYALSTDANGRIRIVDGTGAGELDTSSGKVSIIAADITSIQSGLATAVALAAVKTDTAAILLDTGTDGVVVASGSKSGYSLTQSFPPNFASLAINTSGHVSRVTLVDTTTVNTDMRGTDGANTTPPDNAGIAAVKGKTDQLTFTIPGRADATAQSGISTLTAQQVWEYATRTLTAFSFSLTVNVGAVNGVTLQGDGTEGNPWGPT